MKYDLYKFIDEDNVKKFDADFVVIDNTIYTNPKEEHARKVGYKELKLAEEKPNYNEETQYIRVKYTDGDIITQEYIVEDYETETVGE